MQKFPAIGDNGMIGWTAGFDDLEEYRDAVSRALDNIQHQWGDVRPVFTTRRIAYQPPKGGPLAIVTPAEPFMQLLRRGGVIRHMRVVDQTGRPAKPLFEGTGERLPSMTEDEALAFLTWKDVPHGANRVEIIDAAAIPDDRSQRNRWYLGEDGQIRVAA